MTRLSLCRYRMNDNDNDTSPTAGDKGSEATGCSVRSNVSFCGTATAIKTTTDDDADNDKHHHQQQQERFLWWTETTRIFQLVVPTMMVGVGFFLPQAATVSLVGRKHSTEALAGFTLGNLTANLFTKSFLWGLLYAHNTMSPQAFGAGNQREASLLAI